MNLFRCNGLRHGGNMPRVIFLAAVCAKVETLTQSKYQMVDEALQVSWPEESVWG